MSAAVSNPRLSPSEQLRRIIRESRALADLERATGVRRSRINRFLKGRTTLTLSILDRLAPYLALALVRAGEPVDALVSPRPSPSAQLRRIIRESGLSLAALERVTGVRAAIGGFLKGRTTLTLDTVDRLVPALALELVKAGEPIAVAPAIAESVEALRAFAGSSERAEVPTLDTLTDVIADLESMSGLGQGARRRKRRPRYS